MAHPQLKSPGNFEDLESINDALLHRRSFENVVSNTYTINFSFGSGIVVPGTGMLLNNEMDDFAAKPGLPNGYGLVQGEPTPYRRAVDHYPP